MRNVVKLALFAGMGLYDRVREIVNDLVERGELMQHEGEEIIAEAKKQEAVRTKGIQERVESSLRSAIEKMPKPATSKDVAALEERIRVLEAKLEAATTAHTSA